MFNREVIKLQEVIKYVPLYADDRPYSEKWADKSYLVTLSTLNTNKVFMGEVLNSLKNLRDHADKAETPEELKGCNCGIAIIKKLLMVAEIAKQRLRQMEAIEKANEGDSPSG